MLLSACKHYHVRLFADLCNWHFAMLQLTLSVTQFTHDLTASVVLLQEPKEDDMDMDVDDEPMRIVRNYQRHDAR